MIGRRVSATGRTSAFLGGRSAAAPDLQALGSRLLAFYGQRRAPQADPLGAELETLDGFAGERHLSGGATCEAHAEVIRLERELERIGRRSACEPRLAPLRARRDRRAQPTPERRTSLRRSANQFARRVAARRRRRGARGRLGGRRRGWSGGGDGFGRSGPRRPGGRGSARSTGWPTARGCGWSSRSWRGKRRIAEESRASRVAEQVEERLEVLDRLKRKHGGWISSRSWPTPSTVGGDRWDRGRRRD